jgi:hypothetical protein
VYVPPAHAFGVNLGAYKYTAVDTSLVYAVESAAISIDVQSVNDAPVVEPVGSASALVTFLIVFSFVLLLR